MIAVVPSTTSRLVCQSERDCDCPAGERERQYRDEGRRSIAQRDKEARIRGDLLGGHDRDASAIRIIGHDKTEQMIVLVVGSVERPLVKGVLSSDVRAVADALALVLHCEVTPERADATQPQ